MLANLLLIAMELTPCPVTSTVAVAAGRPLPEGPEGRGRPTDVVRERLLAPILRRCAGSGGRGAPHLCDPCMSQRHSTDHKHRRRVNGGAVVGGRRAGGSSPVRALNVDEEEDKEEACGELVGARRSVSEQGEAQSQRTAAAAPRCCAECGRSCLLETCGCGCGCSQGAPEPRRSLVQPFGSFIEFGASEGNGAGAPLPRQLSSVSAEQLAVPSLDGVAEVKLSAESGAAVLWIRRTVSGIGAMSGLSSGDSSEAQHRETPGNSSQGPELSPSQSCPSTAEGPAPGEGEQEHPEGGGRACLLSGQGQPANLLCPGTPELSVCSCHRLQVIPGASGSRL